MRHGPLLCLVSGGVKTGHTVRNISIDILNRCHEPCSRLRLNISKHVEPTVSLGQEIFHHNSVLLNHGPRHVR